MVMVVKATLNNISGISWQPILFIEETNRSTRLKPSSCRTSLNNFITRCCI